MRRNLPATKTVKTATPRSGGRSSSKRYSIGMICGAPVLVVLAPLLGIFAFIPAIIVVLIVDGIVGTQAQKHIRVPTETRYTHRTK